MSSLLDAANAEPNKIEVTDQLPIRVGDVSIMTIEQAYIALANSNSNNDIWSYDPSSGYDTSTYYVYGIIGNNGTNSTASNLHAVCLNWYKQYNKPTSSSQAFTSNGKTIFGVPLSVMCYGGSRYGFHWYYSVSHGNNSASVGYWDSSVSPSVYVAVVRVHE